MAERRKLKGNLDLQRNFVSEDGNHYRHIRQDDKAIREHVRYLNHKVNEAPKSGNRNGWEFAGVMTWGHMAEFLEEQGKKDGVFYTMHHFATNWGGIKDIFKEKYLNSNEFRDLRGDRQKLQVSVPKSIMRQASDVIIGG